MDLAHSFHTYVAATIEEKLISSKVVVLYDQRCEFVDFIQALNPVDPDARHPYPSLPQVTIHNTPTLLAQFTGSFFRVKLEVEANMALSQPAPMLVYIPGQQRDRKGSVLMELEKAGTSYEPQLRSLARNALRKRFTDGDIDQMLAPDNLSYQDVVRLLTQEGAPQTSLLKLVLGDGSSEVLLARWLAIETYDAELETKQATPELLRLIESRVGLALPNDTPLIKARRQVARYLLINEFRDDLMCEAPDSLNLIAAVPTSDEYQRVRLILQDLRQHYPTPYQTLADSIEAEMNLASLNIDPSLLGRIDTFRFEERALLNHAAQICCDGQYATALSIVTERSRSFWVDQYLDRLAQWQACQLVAEVGQWIERVRPQLQRMAPDTSQWVNAYTDKGGWFEVDRAQRALEVWLAKMDEEPEPILERAIGVVRRAHETLLEAMAQGFTDALIAQTWSTPGVLHQTRIFPEHVEGVRGRVAYFWVDAMRYEMGVDLAEQLHDGHELTLLPAIAALPSITPVGMAALLPEASASFSVVDSGGKLASQIGSSTLANLNDRLKFLRSRYPDAKDIELGDLLQKTLPSLKRKVESTSLLIVRSQTIDGLGEMDGGLLARQIMDTVIGNLARAVRRLAKLGFETFVIAADHGHQFALRKQEDMMIDKPGGTCVDQHRRCWAGQGGQTAGACIRASGRNLGYDTDLDFIFPKGLAVFKAGGDLAFHHGGISLQEMVIPVLKLRFPAQATEPHSSTQILLEGYPPQLTNRTFGMRIFRQADLLNPQPIPIKITLVAEGQEVGRAGMALDAEFDRVTSCIMLPTSQEISVAMMLTSEEHQTIRVVAQDPATDEVLAQSEEISVHLSL